MAIVTCRTDGCANADIGIELERPIDPETGQPFPDPWIIVCGPCGRPITDVDDTPNEATQRPEGVTDE